MIQMCIVEDDKATAATLKKYVERYSELNEVECATSVYYNTADFLRNYPAETDIVFMDIELPDGNGMETVKKLRETNKSVLVIFVTNLAQYAVKGYEVNAFDFIVKPVSYYQFAMKLRRAFECLQKLRNRVIWVVTRHGKKFVNANTIIYVEVMKHMITYHTTEGDVVGTGTLKSVSAVLEGLPFALCNRCYLINLSFVTEINGSTVTVGGTDLQVSEPRRKAFLQSFNDYLSSGGVTLDRSVIL